jgi:hypothetical protein
MIKTFIIFSFRKHNNIFELSIILNNDASVLESFFQIFSMAGMYFSEFCAKLVPNKARYYDSVSSEQQNCYRNPSSIIGRHNFTVYDHM